MAILVAAGGAALGTAIGVGPGAGWLAGAALGNLLFPTQGPESRVEGPRLGDLTVTSSAYGASIAIGYGTLRMAGNMIWSSGISEARNVSRSRAGGKGGGGATQTAVSYSYTASFALSFGEGPAEDVLRLWADGKLIYDKTGLAADVARPGLRFRFHPGSEEQLPDPLIEAHVGDGRAPAHRGLCQLVFEDLPLADFGKRASLPLPTMHSRSQASLELAMAQDATTAKRIAEMSLVSAWLERSTYEAALPPDFLRLEPTDVVDVVLPGGSTFRSRITRLDVGADFSLRLEGVSESAAAYVSTALAEAGSGRPLQRIAVDATTRLTLADLPLLRDVDDTAGAGARLYYLMAGYGGPGWPGAALYRSSDGSAWSQVGRTLGEAAWGVTVNALGSPRSTFSTDEANALVVFMTTGGERLESVTQQAMLNGANAALVLKANGVRRTRIGDDLKDGTGTVPLGEVSESYEVDILDGPDGAVLRTLSSTTPSVVYGNADILADFGSVPASLTVAVHQLSATAGRGFARTVSLPIN